MTHNRLFSHQTPVSTWTACPYLRIWRKNTNCPITITQKLYIPASLLSTEKSGLSIFYKLRVSACQSMLDFLRANFPALDTLNYMWNVMGAPPLFIQVDLAVDFRGGSIKNAQIPLALPSRCSLSCSRNNKTCLLQRSNTNSPSTWWIQLISVHLLSPFSSYSQLRWVMCATWATRLYFEPFKMLRKTF